MGDYVWIGENSKIQALRIGSYISIGKNCDIKDRVVINDNAMILDDSVVEQDTIIPSFTVYGGNPAVFQGLLVESFPMIMKQKNDTYFNKFIGINPKKKESVTDGNKSARNDTKNSVKEIRDSELSQKPMTAREKTEIINDYTLDSEEKGK